GRSDAVGHARAGLVALRRPEALATRAEGDHIRHRSTGQRGHGVGDRDQASTRKAQTEVVESRGSADAPGACADRRAERFAPPRDPSWDAWGTPWRPLRSTAD